MNSRNGGTAPDLNLGFSTDPHSPLQPEEPAIALAGILPTMLIPEVVTVTVLAGICLAAVAREFGLVHFALPENARQVPQYVLRRPVAQGAFQFGFELGTGVRTYVTSTAPYVLLSAVVLNGALLPGLFAGLGFGLGRAAVVFLRRIGQGALAWDGLVARQARLLSGVMTVGISVFAF